MYFYASGSLSMWAGYTAICMYTQLYELNDYSEFTIYFIKHLIVFTFLIIGLWYATYDWNLEYSILKSNLQRSFIVIALIFGMALIPKSIIVWALILLLSFIDGVIVNSSFRRVNRKIPEEKLEQVN
jgi:fumarate reductase subunit D